jgi:hypothetical protein
MKKPLFPGVFMTFRRRLFMALAGCIPAEPDSFLTKYNNLCFCPNIEIMYF